MSTPPRNTLIDGRYKVLSRLGSGGMADVFLAEDEALSRKVALKLLHARFAADPDFVERFRREAQAAAGLQHPNVVSVYDRGSYDDTYYIAMEYLPGRSLKQLIREEAPLDPIRAIDITLQILRAARFAHRRGVIHRDLKPHNVIVDDSDQAKVTDFGIARAGASDMTETGSIMGTAQYLSPEQAQGHSVGAGSDLYSIGVVLYEMLTGRVPFDADAAVTIALKHVSEAPIAPSQINPNIPPELEQVVLWVLNKNPADRPTDADQLITALEHAKATILSGASGQNTASMAAVMAGAAEGTGAGAALGAFPFVEQVPYGEPSTNGTGEHDRPPDDEHRRWLPWLIGLLVLLLIAGAATGAYFLSRPKQRVVPNVTGEQLSVARAFVQREGFVVAVVRVTSSRPQGIVIREDPNHGTKADKGSTVTLSVSAGPGKRAIPSVIGLSQAAATKLLVKHKFAVRTVSQSSQSIRAGDAIKTDPPAGKAEGPGTEVVLFVSSGKPQKPVPNVVGQNQSAAAAELTAAGFSVNSTAETSATAQAGTVVSQSPRGNSNATPGSTVTIVIAKAQAKNTVPPVIGDTASGATNSLSAAGFKVIRTIKNVTNSAQNGIVVSQTPGGGAKAQKGTTVTIVVGKFTPPATTTTPSTPTTTTTPSTPTSTTTPGSPKS